MCRKLFKSEQNEELRRYPHFNTQKTSSNSNNLERDLFSFVFVFSFDTRKKSFLWDLLSPFFIFLFLKEFLLFISMHVYCFRIQTDENLLNNPQTLYRLLVFALFAKHCFLVILLFLLTSSLISNDAQTSQLSIINFYFPFFNHLEKLELSEAVLMKLHVCLISFIIQHRDRLRSWFVRQKSEIYIENVFQDANTSL
jgi:hypothetical protein